MRTFLRRLGAFLLFLLVALCFAPTFVPPFLDRVYYRARSAIISTAGISSTPNCAARRSGSTRAASSTAGPMASAPPGRTSSRSIRPCRRPGSTGSDMLVTWIGHSTVLIQTAGLNILTDPIWSERASPFSFIGPRRVRAPGVRFEDLPRIDLVLISHNHYDHMDLPTLERLWDRDRPLIVTSLGNDTILRGEGIEAVARDWGQSVAVRRGVDVMIERNHHWGSRWGTDRNRALWSASRSARRPATSSSPATPAGAAAAGRATRRATAHSGSPSFRSAPICRAT